jgi:hypothetical protein
MATLQQHPAVLEARRPHARPDRHDGTVGARAGGLATGSARCTSSAKERSMAASLGRRHVNLNVTDLARSVRFHTEAFGFEVLREFPDTTIVIVEGREVERRQAMLTTSAAGDLLALSQGGFLPGRPGVAWTISA